MERAESIEKKIQDHYHERGCNEGMAMKSYRVLIMAGIFVMIQTGVCVAISCSADVKEMNASISHDNHITSRNDVQLTYLGSMTSDPTSTCGLLGATGAQSSYCYRCSWTQDHWEHTLTCHKMSGTC